MSATQEVPRNLKGKLLSAANGKTFTILKGAYYPQEEIGQQHRKYLATLRSHQLVSVSFYGQPVPLIVVEGGVVRLEVIDCNDKVVEGAQAISKKLGIKDPRKPVMLQ